MANNRIHYAAHQVGIHGDSEGGTFNAIHGVQSFSMRTNFNLTPVFEIGQLSIYENVEGIPDVEISLSKVLDGYPLIFHRATIDNTLLDANALPSLIGRSNAKCVFGASIFADTLNSATGTPGVIVQSSGMYISSLSYNFPLDGEFTEDVTLVGNDRVWSYTGHLGASLNPTLPTPVFAGAFNGADSPQTDGGISTRESLILDPAGASVANDANGMALLADVTILPPEVFGISSSGVNEGLNTAAGLGAHLSNISVSVDLGRESINELGRKAPYHRYAAYPVQVTTEIEVTSTSGDLISATESGIYTTGTTQCLVRGNLRDRTIRIATCDGTRLYLGLQNKLESVNYGGGDAGGGNVSVTYTFSTYNDLTVLHSGDPNTSGTTWWAARGTYLLN